MYEHGVMMDGRLLIARYRITALTGVLGGRGGVLTAVTTMSYEAPGLKVLSTHDVSDAFAVQVDRVTMPD